MAPFLPADVLCQIFQNLSDQKSLHSSLLVNRLWCATSVEYLWSKPFHFVYTCGTSPCACHEGTRVSRSSKLVEVYLSCLTEKEKLLLIENGVQLPIEVKQSPLFDYAGFIRHLDLEEFYTAIRDWIDVGVSGFTDYESRHVTESGISKKSKKFRLSNVVRYITKTLGGVGQRIKRGEDKSDSESNASIETTTSTIMTIPSTPTTPTSPTSPTLLPHPRERLVAEVLCRLLMRRSSTLKQLSIDRTCFTHDHEEFRCASLPPLMDRFHNNRMIPEQYLMLPTYPGAASCLSSLSELVCTVRQPKRKLFDLLSEVSHKIHKISVTIDNLPNGWYGTRSRKEESDLEDEAKSLSNLIRSQQSLQHFEIYGCEIGSSVIVSALKTQTHCLKSLCFNNVRFWSWEPLDFIVECQGLQKLAFRSCHGLTNEIMGTLVNVRFPQLSTIEMENSLPSVHTVTRRKYRALFKFKSTQ